MDMDAACLKNRLACQSLERQARQDPICLTTNFYQSRESLGSRGGLGMAAPANPSLEKFFSSCTLPQRRATNLLALECPALTGFRRVHVSGEAFGKQLAPPLATGLSPALASVTRF